MRKRKKSNHRQTTMFSPMTEGDKRRFEEIKIEYRQVVWALEAAKHLSERPGLWGSDLERYGDNRLMAQMWWLIFDLDEWFSDAPKVDNYEFGNYWTGHKEGSDQFVKDRSKWAIPHLEEDLQQRKEVLLNLTEKRKGWHGEWINENGKRESPA